MKRAHNLGCVLAVTFILGIWPAGVESCLAVEIVVELDSILDRFGSQIETVQVYEDASGPRATFGIYDTGASVVTLSAYDQMFLKEFGGGIPIKVFGGATAEGIGGSLTGDVSQPGTILAAGIEAVTFDAYFNMVIDDVNVPFAEVPGVQLFVGTPTGSPHLSTITGTPIHNGRLNSPDAPNGVAAKIDMQWAGFDLGALFPEFGDLFKGVFLNMPNIRFVSPGTEELQPVADDPLTPIIDETTTDPVRIPLAMYGEDNHEDPGDMITYSYNPFQNTGVVLSHNDFTVGDDPNDRKAMLFDTGAQLSIISNEMATDLGLDVLSPEFSVAVQGAAGGIGRIPGFVIDALELPVDNDRDGTHDETTVRFTNVPLFVYDITPADTDPEEGLDGILGMNLFNTASEMLYDPFDSPDPSLSVTFLENPYREDLDEEALGELEMILQSLDEVLRGLEGFEGELFPAFLGPLGGMPGLRGPGVIPEPSTLALLTVGGLLLLFWRLRRTRA